MSDRSKHNPKSAGVEHDEALEIEIDIEGDDPYAEAVAEAEAAAEARPSGDKPGKKRGLAKELSNAADGKGPSKDEVLNRLLEKNEIIVKLNKANVEKDKEIKELNDKWLRSVAEFENYRKRSRKEWELLKQQSKTEVILEILNVVDDFERAFSVAGDEDDEFQQGIRLIYNNFLQVLEKFGVTEAESLHQPFDPVYHMAVGQIESQDVDSGCVAEVVQKGYLLDETVIRPAKVIVAK